MKTHNIKNKTVNFFFKPSILSLFISIITILFLPQIFNKYEVTFLKKEKSREGIKSYYVDLDNDGFSEKIDVNSIWENQTALFIYSKGHLIDQWNFDGIQKETGKIYWHDIDNDNKKEIFALTLRGDSIVVNCFDPLNKKILIKDKLVSFYSKFNNTIDYAIIPCGFYDFNNDNYKEFYFSIITGYSQFPRNMFALDIKNDTVFISPRSCNNIYNPIAFDIDKDKVMEFSGSANATGNCESEDEFTDKNTWLMVFDEELNFKFNPVKINKYPAFLEVNIIHSNKEVFLFVLNLYYGNENLSCSIQLYNTSGDNIKEKLFEYSEEWYDASLIRNTNLNNNNLYVIKRNGNILEFDYELNIISEINIPPIISTIPQVKDLDNDGTNEYIFWDKFNENLIITSSDFDNEVFINFNKDELFRNMSVILKRNEDPELYISGNKYSYFYKYYQNPWYYLKYLVYIIIYFGIYSIIFAMQKVQQYRLEQKYKAEKQIKELQIKSIKNQTDPHFTLNIINSIGALFANQDKDQANYVFGKYSKLLRLTILNSDKILTSINEEIDYVKNYLDLEKFRLSTSLDYEIEIDKSVNMNLEIPKMILHTFVENAIKHGIRHSEKEGKISINVFNNRTEYEIIIRDNGIGREKAKLQTTFSTGKGLKILDQILDLYFSIKNVKIDYKIIDLIDNSNRTIGTEVKIKIPLN